jgi:class 3 adenylate cyclase
VAIGGDGWLPRFDAALARATRIIHATEEHYLGDDVLFEHAARLVEGLTVLRAAQLQTTPRLLCVIDEASRGRVGGTLSAFERWAHCIGPPDIIELAALRARAVAGAQGSTSHSASGSPALRATNGDRGTSPPGRGPALERPGAPASSDPVPDPAVRPSRTLKTLLFADFTGYSRLQDVNASRFQGEFWAIAARHIASSAAKPLFANTWGDGLYLVFESPGDGAAFATRLSSDMRAIDWTTLGLPDTSQIRVCLHAGPVFCAFDPIIERDNYFGSSVTRAARIEPITPPGTVFASEAFAATLAATGQRDFTLEYVGSVLLAKGFGESRIYRLASS